MSLPDHKIETSTERYLSETDLCSPQENLHHLNCKIISGDYESAKEIAIKLLLDDPSVWTDVYDIINHGQRNGHLPLPIRESILPNVND
jgi:hypothetical protein